MWINKFVFLLPVVCIAVFSTAQTVPPQPIGPVPSQDPSDCLSSLETIPDCIPAIFRSIINGQIGSIGYSCCHAFLGITTECATHVFVFAPFFPPTLRDHCSRQH
ncbi:Prolamin-like protein [Hirschfeldia incana]|nr:Prolamin-like protein [Hirschfeldia incana]